FHLKAVTEANPMNGAKRERDDEWHICDQPGQPEEPRNATFRGREANCPIVDAVGELIALREGGPPQLVEVFDPGVRFQSADLRHPLAGDVGQVERALESGLGNDLVYEPHNWSE